jgi:hypothetical protein
VPLQASAEPGDGDGLAVASGSPLAGGEGVAAGPVLGTGEAGWLEPAGDDGPGDATVGAGDAVAADEDGVPPHAARSTATLIRATGRVAGTRRGRVMATSRA